MCNRLTKLSVTMWYTFFGIFDDTSLWILPKTHDPSLCDTPDDIHSSAPPPTPDTGTVMTSFCYASTPTRDNCMGVHVNKANRAELDDRAGDTGTVTSMCVTNKKDMAHLSGKFDWHYFVTVLRCSITKITGEVGILVFVRVFLRPQKRCNSKRIPLWNYY